MPSYRFTTSWVIDAKDINDAREKFADASFDFAADAEVQELREDEL